MKRLLNIIAFCLIAIASFAEDGAVTNDSPAAQKELLFQRFLKELQQSAPSDPDLSSTNPETLAAFRRVFESAIIDPSFGFHWDEVPAPTLVDSNAMSAVDLFVSTNGWNMQTNDCIFDCIPTRGGKANSKPLRGLPWAAIREKEFPAVTHDNILYVFFGGFHHDGHGVAYNPHANHFAATVDSFKPIGQHWYVWAFDHEFRPSVPQPQIYEGTKPLTNGTSVSK